MDADHGLPLWRAAPEQKITYALPRVGIRLGRCQAWLARRRDRVEDANQSQIFVHLMESRLRQRRRVGEEPAPRSPGNPDGAGRPVDRARRGLEREVGKSTTVSARRPAPCRRRGAARSMPAGTTRARRRALFREKLDPGTGEQHGTWETSRAATGSRRAITVSPSQFGRRTAIFTGTRGTLAATRSRPSGRRAARSRRTAGGAAGAAVAGEPSPSRS